MNDNDIIHKVFIKPSYDTRTFETRLLFIKELFEHTFDPVDIMGRCILYKLDTEGMVDEQSLKTFIESYYSKMDDVSVNQKTYDLIIEMCHKHHYSCFSS